MKKVAALSLVVVVLLIAAAISVVYWKRLAPPTIRPEALLPPETLLMVEAADLPRTALRWPGTELYKLWEEPEVKAFLEKPLASHPLLAQLTQRRSELAKLWPRQLFFAVTAAEGSVTKMIGGFSYAGNHQIADGWFAEARRRMKEAHPAGKAEIVLHGKVELETYTDQAFFFAEATHAGWHLAANNLELLKSTLDRVQAGKNGHAPTLASETDYRKAFAALPADADLRLFARTGVFVDRLLTAAAAGEPKQTAGLASLRNTRALAAVSKIEGGQMRDTVFSLNEKRATPSSSLAQNALELTDANSAVFYTTRIEASGVSSFPPEMRGMLPFAGTLDAALKQQGATVADLPTIFGPEISLLMARPKGAMNWVLAVGLRDPARAASLAEALAAPALGTEMWTVSEEEGQKVYAAPPSGGLVTISPVLVTTDRYWLLSTSQGSLLKLANREPATPQLDHTAAYRELAKSIVAPTDSFGYLDLGALFDSYYSSLRPMLALGLVGSETSGQYFDAGKLPSGPVLAKHLGALVFSQGSAAEGTLWEARGTLSPGPLILGGVAAFVTGSAKLPALGVPLTPAGLSGARTPTAAPETVQPVAPEPPASTSAPEPAEEPAKPAPRVATEPTSAPEPPLPKR